jgi:hypothetical protein
VKVLMKKKVQEVLTMKGREELEPYLEILFLELVIKADSRTGIVNTSFEELCSIFAKETPEIVSGLKRLRDLGYIGLELNKEAYDDSIDAIASQHPGAPLYIDVIDYGFYVDKLRMLEPPSREAGDSIGDCYARLLATVFQQQPSRA